MNDIINDIFTNPKKFANFVIGHISCLNKASNLKYLGFNKQGSAVIAANMAAICVAAITAHVGVIVGLGA